MGAGLVANQDKDEVNGRNKDLKII